MYRLLAVLTKQMGAVFPELLAQKQLIQNVIKEEEASFLRTLDQGLVLLDRIINSTKALKFLETRHLNYTTPMDFRLI